MVIEDYSLLSDGVESSVPEDSDLETNNSTSKFIRNIKEAIEEPINLGRIATPKTDLYLEEH